MARYMWNPYSMTHPRVATNDAGAPLRHALNAPQAATMAVPQQLYRPPLGATANSAQTAASLHVAVSLLMNGQAHRPTGPGVLVWAPSNRQFTMTMQYDLQIPGHGPQTVRAHVHIVESVQPAIPHVFIAGNYWIRGYPDWQAQTPRWVVQYVSANPPTQVQLDQARMRNGG